MPAGSIVVELLAKTGSFDTDIDRSTKATEKRMREMQRTVDTVGAAVGLALAGAATAAVAFGRHIIDGIDALNDVADATGAAVEKISALEDIGARTGTSMETITAGMVKFNGVLKDLDPKSAAADVFRKLGLDAERLKQMDPADALLATARAFQGFEADGTRARNMQELFGKSTAKFAAYMKDLAEKTELVGTVSAQQAQEVEDFNKQLFQMQKNSTDAARAFVSDLIPGINAAAQAMRESGLGAGIQALFTGTDAHKANVEIAEVTGQILELQNTIDKTKAQVAGGGLTGWLAGAKLPTYTKELDDLNARLRAAQALLTVQTPGFLSTPGLPPAPKMAAGTKTVTGPKGKDPDADFRAYLKNLQEQIQKVDQLTVSEKLLDDIRRGSLTVSPAQEKQLSTLAALVDKDKQRKEVMEATRAAFVAGNDTYLSGLAEEKRRIDEMLASGPAAQLEKQRADMALLAAEFQKFIDTAGQYGISQAQYLDAVTGSLNLTAQGAEHFNLQLTGTQNLLMDIGSSGMRAFEDLALHGGKFGDVMKRLLEDVASMIFQLTVAKPLMDQLRGAIGGGVSPPNPDAGFSWGNLFSSAAQAFAGGGSAPARAGGGPVSANQPYMIGERGPEMFVPRTAGSVVPNSALGAGGGSITIVNPPGTRVDSVSEQRQPNGDRVITQHVVAQIGNPNSDMSRAMQRAFNLRPKR
jgi:hypothetical protein